MAIEVMVGELRPLVWTRDEYDRMAVAGLLGDGRGYELIGGVVHRPARRRSGRATSTTGSASWASGPTRAPS
jgi:hypothetical protein